MLRNMNNINDNFEIHNMAVLEHYNIFNNEQNTILKTAFIINPNLVRITLKNSEIINQGDLEIWEWDYGNFNIESNTYNWINKQTPDFQQNNYEIFINFEQIDFNKNYIIAFKDEWLNIFLDPAIGGIIDTVFDANSQKDFGVKLNDDYAVFKVWSPPAARIDVIFYDENQNQISVDKTFSMIKDKQGVFSLMINSLDVENSESLEGLFYQYKVFAYGKAKLALDPYSFSMAAFNPNGDDKIGKSAIVSMKSGKSLPTNFRHSFSNSSIMANDVDLIAYELHIRDFTSQVGVVKHELSGTFVGATKKINYLKQLGITHVQLMPVMNFYTINETNRTFSNSEATNSNYNWGYDPHNYFSLEGWFSTDATNPYKRIIEFKELVNELHKNNIGVILDVVYNHTYIVETYENIAPTCYYRYNSEMKISGHSGAGPSLETRHSMVRKLIIDSLKHFVTEYHIDGFRFDLMGFIDHETMKLIRKEVGKVYNPNNINELILHGEAWIFSDLDTSENTTDINAATTKINYPKENINLAFFNDTSRDSYAGKNENRGFVQGNFLEIDRVVSAIVGGIKTYKTDNLTIHKDVFYNNYNLFAEYPSSCLNYLSIHDGLTLWDKINLSWQDSTGFERARLMRLASAMLFTSQGKIILHGGDELLRTKPLSKFDKERNRALTSQFVNEEENSCYFHENSYCSNDYTNMFRWDRMNNQYAPIVRNMIEYYKGLILMRRSISALRMNLTKNICNGLKFISISNNNCIAYLIDNTLENEYGKGINKTYFSKIFVAHNASESSCMIDIPKINNNEEWSVILDSNNSGIKPLQYSENPTKGQTDVLILKDKIQIPYKSSVVLVKYR